MRLMLSLGEALRACKLRIAGFSPTPFLPR
jgi:hypothetical protein